MLVGATALSGVIGAKEIIIKEFRHSGPHLQMRPLMIDTVDNRNKPFDGKAMAEASGAPVMTSDMPLFSDSILSAPSDADAVNVLAFTIDNPAFTKGKLIISGADSHSVYVDGRKADGELSLTPGYREIAIRTYTAAGTSDTIRVAFDMEGDNTVNVSAGISAEGKRLSAHDIFTGQFMVAPSISPSGRYLLSGRTFRNHDGKTADTRRTVTDLKTGATLMTTSEDLAWMPTSDRLYKTRERDGARQLISLSPDGGNETIIASGLTSDPFIISPTEDFLVYTVTDKGPEEKSKSLYEIINPEDRQPGWRDRNRLVRHDFATGMLSPLTFGSKSSWLEGLTSDGKKALVITGNQLNMTERPSSRMSLLLVDMPTMKADTLVAGEGFMGGATLSPDGRMVALTASPEAFGGIGNVLPEGVTPNAYDYQLYVMDCATKAITPLTRDFNPAVQSTKWGSDGKIYFVAQDRDREVLYRAEPATGVIEEIPAGEDFIFSYSVAAKAPVIAYYGESADNSHRLYTLNTSVKTSKMRPVLRDDLHPERYGDIRLGKTERWEFTNAEGDTIYASYNLPQDFDPSKKYPMIVYYYGGCSPTARMLDSTYNPHLWAAQGYVALEINPRGAAGFGQEYASHHVATAGEGVADDIITGVKKFCEENPFVDSSKVGCMGASYGGFMTQYLQTVTDIFAAAVSHAGISDHTSYWGNGYWGYSYSEVSMGDKLPWSDRKLYVDHSPIYNADKINTPLLLLHGDCDTNVPFGESVQLFTALKRLGKETALVAVRGENHHVLPIDKRIEWVNTQMAWFAKYLKDDPSWWESLYPAKNL